MIKTTVGELIAKLSDHDPDARIVIGYRPSNVFRKLPDGNAAPLTGVMTDGFDVETVNQRNGSVMIR